MPEKGALIPPWYQFDQPSCEDLAIVSIVWGMALTLTAFGLIRVVTQTYRQWKRARRVTTYMVLIWLELISSAIIGGLAWGYVHGNIPPGFEIYFAILFLWVFQIHCIMQIIINRIALLAVSQTTVRRIKWGTFAILVVINISVFCVWLPARLQINKTYIYINDIWDRVEKGIFAAIDLALNLYFVYLVRSSLISYGLTKYVVLYRYNLVMVTISISMDMLIIASMSFEYTFLYVEFHPVAYLVKLHIELSMAELIAKIVKASGPDLSCHCNCHSHANRIFLNNLHPRHTSLSRPGTIAPTTGRFRRSWPVWPRDGRVRAGRVQNPSEQEAPPRKRPRTADNEPRNVTWTPEAHKASDWGLSSLQSSMGQSSRSTHDHNDHND
ncbi:uncharacterized protein NECHADRAFT_47370 [Fusarium vanettenii 77-13-4]|uniref:Integral membrane protein n=1 Tax=Fusarium vanettenii (strain ATCC MYA-4622 / CBS 123669 / FGSC 9596 / NRRL 45880 / 77-13-4) TaxID=660122 RepID=C7YZD3_FUSV7|nr:uncharacterized protein NECHADRAFT_47370 [Fusarium vanettenii 77-13-4]EEU42583.1 hypothetical protein NECHADRAFT_47370 [Fusarium vanettenii 77-13-4]